MRFFTSQNKNNNNNDYDVTSSDYPQTVEIPTSSSSSPSSEEVVVVNNHNDSDDEGYDEFLRVCMNSMVSICYLQFAILLQYGLHMKSLYSPDI